jgi:radical SAM-linked protein
LKTELRFAVTGRARFLSHLECVDVLLAAFRRADMVVALSEGMRPKPVISLAVARAVGVASEDELATVDVVGDLAPEVVATRLAATLPRGIEIRSARASEGTPRVTSARYRVLADAAPGVLDAGIAAYESVESALVERRSPKGTKVVDVAQYASAIEVVEGGFEVEVAIVQDGTARPEEVARALAALVGADITVRGITRTALRVGQPVAATDAGPERRDT